MSEDSSSSESQVMPSNPVAAPVAPVEKMVPQSTVNHAIGRAKEEARQAERTRLEKEWSQRDNAQSLPAASQGNSSLGGMNPEDIRKIIAEETMKAQQSLVDKHQQDTRVQNATRVATEFMDKINAGLPEHSDYKEVVSALPFAEMSQVVDFANRVENTAAVMYDLGKNPAKIANLTVLAHMNPALAQMEMNRLSQSIKLNEAAKSVKTPNEPLSQIRPSPVGVDSGSKMSVTDYRQKYRNK